MVALDNQIRNRASGFIPFEDNVGVNFTSPEFIDNPVETVVLGIQVGMVNLMNISQAHPFDRV